ncbi:MAG TPA: ABC transporter ATP-binding protein, partial [Acidimicrobiales bacterium]|nr:ABC transporter ATP-binding protein [Acidimicrobiales bacterium]
MRWLGGLRGAWNDFRRTIMYTLLARQRTWVIWLFVTAAGWVLVQIGTADTLRKLVDDGVVERSRPVGELVELLVGLAFLGLVFGLGLRQVIARLTYHLEFELRVWLYERLQSTDPQRLDGLATGQMVTRAMTDLLLLELVILIVPTVAIIGLSLFAVFVLMAIIHPWLALLAITVIPVNFAIVMRIRRRLWGMSWVTLDRRAKVTTVIDESVRGARVVKAFGREEHERGRLAAAARAAYGVAMTRARLVARYDLVLAAMPGLVMAMLTWLGAWEGVNGRLTVGDLYLFFAYALTFAAFARLFATVQSIWQFAKTGAGRIFELIAYAKPAVVTRGVPLPEAGEGLVLDRAVVRINDHPVLGPLSCTAAPGEVVVVSGPPRSGKTTFARLVAGGCLPDAGIVTVDGVDLAVADPVALRRAVRVVVEDPFLFGRSVRDNLLLGAPTGTTEPMLWAALDAAGARQVVEDLPQGLDTVLG